MFFRIPSKSLDSRAPRSLCVVHCLCRARPYTATIRANTLPSHFSPLSVYISAPLVHPIQQTRLQSWCLACTQAKRENQAFKLQSITIGSSTEPLGVARKARRLKPRSEKMKKRFLLTSVNNLVGERTNVCLHHSCSRLKSKQAHEALAADDHWCGMMGDRTDFSATLIRTSAAGLNLSGVLERGLAQPYCPGQAQTQLLLPLQNALVCHVGLRVRHGVEFDPCSVRTSRSKRSLVLREDLGRVNCVALI